MVRKKLSDRYAAEVVISKTAWGKSVRYFCEYLSSIFSQATPNATAANQSVTAGICERFWAVVEDGPNTLPSPHRSSPLWFRFLCRRTSAEGF